MQEGIMAMAGQQEKPSPSKGETPPKTSPETSPGDETPIDAEYTPVGRWSELLAAARTWLRAPMSRAVSIALILAAAFWGVTLSAMLGVKNPGDIPPPNPQDSKQTNQQPEANTLTAILARLDRLDAQISQNAANQEGTNQAQTHQALMDKINTIDAANTQILAQLTQTQSALTALENTLAQHQRTTDLAATTMHQETTARLDQLNARLNDLPSQASVPTTTRPNATQTTPPTATQTRPAGHPTPHILPGAAPRLDQRIFTLLAGPRPSQSYPDTPTQAFQPAEPPPPDQNTQPDQEGEQP